MTTDDRPAVGRKVQVWINDGPQLVPGWQVAIVTWHVGRTTVTREGVIQTVGEGRCRLICGEALDELKKMPSESVQCTITSPPYW